MAYENLSREELISALENVTGVGQALPALRDPQTGEDLGWMNADERERFYRHQEQYPEGEDMGWSDYDPAAVHFSADLRPKQGQVDEQGYIGPYGRPDLAEAAQARRDAIFGASVVPNIGSFLDKRPSRFNPDASRNPEDFLDTRPAAFNPDASRNITDHIDPMVSGGAKATPFYEGQIPYFGTDPNLARAMREGRSPTGFDYGSLPSGEEVIDMATGLRPVGDASVVRPIGETIDSVMRQPEQVLEPVGIGDMEPPSEQDLMFHEVQ